MVARRFNRDFEIIAGPLTIRPRTETGAAQTALACKFAVVKSPSVAANTAELTLWNLTVEHRTKLQETGLEVVVKAGYVEELAQLFRGDIERTSIERDAVNWLTRIELGDGTAAMKSSRINASFRGGQSPGDMLKTAAEALGLDIGNLDEKVRTNGARSVLSEFINGFVLSGKTSDVVDKLAASLGLQFSVQDKRLQFLATGEALPEPPVPLSAATGLVGSPSIGEDGTVDATALLHPTVTPGRLVKLETAIVTGTFIAGKVQHTGETWGQDWTTRMELLPQ